MFSVPSFQEKAVREVLRLVEHQFTQYSTVAREGRGVVTATGFKLGPSGLRANPGGYEVDLLASFDIHATKAGAHIKTLATLPIRLEASVDYRRVGGRRILLVRLFHFELPRHSWEIAFSAHPDGDTLPGASVLASFYHDLLGGAGQLRERVESGFAWFLEVGKGSAFVHRANASAGRAFTVDDAVNDAEVSSLLAESSQRGRDGELFRPFELEVCGGDVLYRYRFAVGVFPLLGLDRSMLPWTQRPTRSAPEIKLRLSVQLLTTHGDIQVALARRDGTAILEGQRVGPGQPLVAELKVQPDMLDLLLRNPANRLFEGTPPRVSVRAQRLD